MFETVLTEVRDSILTITINRPDKLNALNQTVMDGLNRAMDQLYSDQEIRAAIITGSGTKAFVAGADIAEFVGLDKENASRLSKKGQDIFFRIENSPKPVVAAVNGFALGGGCELAMACHFRLCSDNAKFGQPEVNLGLIPGYGGTQRLTQLVGKGRALELMMTGSMMTAEEALRYGLVNYVTSPDSLVEKTRAILQIIQNKAPLAVSGVIACVNAACSFDKEKSGFEMEHTVFGECASTEDMKEGARAFLEKRKPAFKGK